MSCTQKQMSLISRMHFIHNGHRKSHILSKQKITKFHEHLIMGLTSAGVDALNASPSHVVYQSLKESLWYCLPLCHKQTGQNLHDWWVEHGYFEVYVLTRPMNAQWRSNLANTVANPS